jgi:hypothetical protein
LAVICYKPLQKFRRASSNWFHGTIRQFAVNFFAFSSFVFVFVFCVASFIVSWVSFFAFVTSFFLGSINLSYICQVSAKNWRFSLKNNVFYIFA